MMSGVAATTFRSLTASSSPAAAAARRPGRRAAARRRPAGSTGTTALIWSAGPVRRHLGRRDRPLDAGGRRAHDGLRPQGDEQHHRDDRQQAAPGRRRAARRAGRARRAAGRSSCSGRAAACRRPRRRCRCRRAPPASRCWRKTPVRMKNSPTNELEPGIASDAIATIRNTPVRRGAPAARPPMPSMRSSGAARLMHRRRSRRRRATTMPWLTICSTAPWDGLDVEGHDAEGDEARGGRGSSRPPAAASWARARRPASRRRCRSPRAPRSGWRSGLAPSGKIGRPMRRKP